MKLLLGIILCITMIAIMQPTQCDAMEIYNSGNYYYRISEDGTAVITGYLGNDENLSVPSELDGYSVTSIGDEAFIYCSNLLSIEIPNSVTSIGVDAFFYCSSLTHITIPDSVTSIGEYAFDECSSLANITIPNSVTNIGEYAFNRCSSLTSITIPDSVTSIGCGAFIKCTSLTSINVTPNNPFYEDINGVLYDKTEKMLHTYLPTKAETSYQIPQGILAIGTNAFRNCNSLISITIPDTVTSIGSWAFYECSSLASITIPDYVNSIGIGTFISCSSLSNLTIPDSVTSIGEYAFWDCSNLGLIVNKGSYAQQYCDTYEIPYNMFTDQETIDFAL